MSDMTTIEFSSKSSMKMVGQVVDLTYHGPIATTDSGGALGMLLRQVSASSDNSSSSDEKSSASVDVLSLLGVNLPTSVDPKRFKDARDTFMVVYSGTQNKVKLFHERLNQLKIKALNGSTRRKLTQAEVGHIRTSMQPANVGKVIKITLQTRLVSENPFVGSHPARDGHSLTKTLYTFYYPYDSKIDVASQLEKAAADFVGWYLQPTGSSTSTQSAEIVVSDNLDNIKIIPNNDVIKTVEFTNGTVKSLNPEELKPKNPRFMLSSAFK